MQTISLGLNLSRELASLAVRVAGSDFVYHTVEDQDLELSRYLYFDYDGKPSCLVGWILFYAGAEPFPFCEENEADVEELVLNGVLDANGDTVEYLGLLQAAQDLGNSWGEAFEIAEKHVRQEVGAA